MTESTNQNIVSSEKISRVYLNLKFEPGSHGDYQELGGIRKQVAQGDLNKFAWNPEVADRIRQYKPKVLTIDGARAGIDWRKTPRNIDFWSGLPDRPSRLNDSGSVLIVAGDQAQYTEALSDPIVDIEMVKQLRDLERRDLFEVDPTAESDAMINASALVELAIGVAALATLSKEKFTRRGLFKRVGALTIGGLAVLGSKYLKDQRLNVLDRTSSAITEPEKDLALTIANYIGPKFLKADWTRARTAMEILKSKDAIDTLGLPNDTPAAVVMGDFHSYDAKGFMESEEACQAAIRTYFNKLQAIVKTGTERAFSGSRYSGEQFYKDQMNKLTNYIAKTEIYEVTDPGEIQPGQKVEDVLTNNIALKNTFSSARVLSALTI